MVARDRRRVRARGRQTPRSGHCESACARLKPQAFIIPRWQSEKSYFTGSSGSRRRSDAVMSRAIAPARAGVAGQPQAAADADDVRVERHDQRRRRHARPDAEIERVAPHHPAQEQVQPLAGAAGRRPREEVADARRAPERAGRRRAVRSSASARLRKAVERRADVARRRVVALEKEPLDRSRCDRSSAAAARAARPDPGRASSGGRCRANAGASRARIEPAHVRRPAVAHDREQPFDRLQHARHAAEGERRRAEADDLAIVRPLEPPDDLNRIGRRIRIVEARVQAVERRLQSVTVGDLQPSSPSSPGSAICMIVNVDYDSGMRRDAARMRRARRRCVVLLLVALAAGGVYLYLRQSLPVVDGTIAVAGLVRAGRDRARCRRHPAHLRRQPRPTRSSASATSTRRIACGRWNFSGASATAGCRRSSARRRCRRIGSCARSASAARREPRGQRLPDDARRRSTPTSPASTRSSPRITAARCRRSSRCSASSRALDRRRRPRVGEDDGVGPERELLARAAAARHRGARRRGAHGRAAAAVSARRSEHRARRRRAARRRHRSRAEPHDVRIGCAPTRRLAGAFARGARRGDPAGPRPPARRRRTEALGSNNWVVDGTLTASGKPLLANDPHLATHVPSLWYLAHISAGDFDVIGATLPGAPAVAIGRNRFIAWGETNVAADVEDLYREHLDAIGNDAPNFRAGRSRSQIIPETIVVKGAPPVHARRARLAARSARLRRDQRQQRRVEDRAEAAADRAARVPLDGARRRRHDDRRVPAS